MSEARHIQDDNLPPPKSDLYVVESQIEIQDPMGSFFDTFPNQAAEHELITYHSPDQRYLLDQGSPEEIVIFALEHVGLLPKYPDPAPKNNLSIDEKTRLTQTIDDITAHRKLVRGLVIQAANYYREEYWNDYSHRQGQDIDRLAWLYERTEAYATTSPFHEMLRKINDDHREHHHVIDALRVVKILLLNERESVDIDLP